MGLQLRVKEFEELTGFDLAKAVWESIGWEVRRFESRAGWKMRRIGESHWCGFMRCDLSISDCRYAEEEIEKKHGPRYYQWLDAFTLRPLWDKHDSLPWGYCIFRADAETRCRAILATMAEVSNG